MNKHNKVIITINRGPGEFETLKGTIIREATTHLLVEWKQGEFSGTEWFARQSNKVNCILV